MKSNRIYILAGLLLGAALVLLLATAAAASSASDDWPGATPENSAARWWAEVEAQLTGQENALAARPFGYSGNSTSDDLSIFDLRTNRVFTETISLLPEGDYPYDATMRPDGREVWVVGAVGDGVVVVETAGNTIVTQIADVGEYGVDVLFGKDGGLAYVSNRDTVDIAIIDTATYAQVGSIPVPDYYLGPGKMALNRCTGEIYVVNWYDDRFFVVDPVTQVVTTDLDVPEADSMWDLVLNPAATTLYIADRGNDMVHVMDVATLLVTTSIPVGDDPWGIDITPNGRLVFVANEDSHDVSVIDTLTNTVVATIPLDADADPRDVEIRRDGKLAYVPSGSIADDDGVYGIHIPSLQVAGLIPLGVSPNPNVIAVSPQRAGDGGCP